MCKCLASRTLCIILKAVSRSGSRLTSVKAVIINILLFIRSKGSLTKAKKLKIDEYAFWEAIFLYNELGEFLWPDSAEPVAKLNENELKQCFYDRQPQKWQQQFEESPNTLKPEEMTVEELKEHFKTKEENHAKIQLQHAEQ